MKLSLGATAERLQEREQNVMKGYFKPAHWRRMTAVTM